MPAHPAADGYVVDIVGAVVRARMIRSVALGDLVWTAQEQLFSEVVALDGGIATMQVFEDTSGVRAGAPVVATGHALEVQLGPGLLGSIFDGVQRPLPALASSDGDYLLRGRHPSPLDPLRRWTFAASVRPDAVLHPGAAIGEVQETPSIRHRVMLPPGVGGRVVGPVRAGDVDISTPLLRIDTGTGEPVPVTLAHMWPAREPRPIARRLPLDRPLVTGQRVLDTFFPVPAGGTVGMPGGFGTGKTVLQQQICKWVDADVIVFIGCGERGNEMAEVLAVLPSITDPRTGRPLSERTVLIANTSDMAVAAREASIYVGATIAEYYRDMGHNVVLLADSTSRWAEALREISGRLEEMPAEEGYPSYLSSRLAAFYERAGRVTTCAGGEGSVTIIGAISPAGGDLTEPVTRHTQRYASSFWTLDRELAHARQFPAVSMTDSYSQSAGAVAAWWRQETASDWARLREEALALLEEADRLETTARLIGTSSLPERQQLVLVFASLFRAAFLSQFAGAGDDWCPPRRQVALLEMLLRVVRAGDAAVAGGVPARALFDLPVLADVRRARTTAADEPSIAALAARFETACSELTGEAMRSTA